MQRWFYTVNADDPRLAKTRAWRQKILDAPLPDLAEAAVQRTPEDWSALLEQFVRDGICEMTGVAAMQAEWVFEGQQVPQRRMSLSACNMHMMRLLKHPMCQPQPKSCANTDAPLRLLRPWPVGCVNRGGMLNR